MSIESEMAEVVASLDWSAADIRHEPELGALSELLRLRLGDGVLRWMLGAVEDAMTSLEARFHDALASRSKFRVLGQHILIDILLALTGDDGFPSERRKIDPDLASDLVARDVAMSDVVAALRHMQRAWLIRLIDASKTVDADTTRLMPDLAASVTTTMDAWVGIVNDALRQERRRIDQTDKRRNRTAIESLISGSPIDTVATAAILRRSLTGWHSCCVIGAPIGEIVDRQQVDAAARAMASKSGGAPPLRYETASGKTFLWTTTESTDVLSGAVLEISPPTRAGIGEPHRGAEGFRRSYLEADDALQLAIRTGADCGLHYRDVALTITLTRDDERARWFVDHELRDLAGDSTEMADMRKTLRTFFATRMRIAPAAERLFIHRNTLIQRLERVESLIGHPLSERTAEVQAALAIADLYLADASSRASLPRASE